MSAPPPPPPAPQQYNAVTDGSVLSGLYINALFGTVLLIGFCIAQTLNKKLYRFRAFSESVSLRPPDIPMKGAWLSKYWMWAVMTWRVTDLDILMSCGLDAFVMTKIPVLGLQLFAPLAFFSIMVLIPLHWSQTWLMEQGGTVNSSDLARITLSAMPPGDPLMWVHVGLLSLYTVYGLGLLHYHFVQFARLRLRYMSRGDDLSFFAEIVTDKVRAVKKQLAHHNAKAGVKQAKPSRAVLALERRLAMLLKVMDGVHKRIHDLEQLRAEAHGPPVSVLDEQPGELTGVTSSHYTPAAAAATQSPAGHPAANPPSPPLQAVLEEGDTLSGASGSQAGSKAQLGRQESKESKVSMQESKVAGPVAEGQGLQSPATQTIEGQVEFTWAPVRRGGQKQHTQAQATTTHRRPLPGTAQAAYRTRDGPVAEGADGAASSGGPASGASALHWQASGGASLPGQASSMSPKGPALQGQASGTREIGASGASGTLAPGASFGPAASSQDPDMLPQKSTLSRVADAVDSAHLEGYEVTGAGRMGAAKVDVLKETAPVMFLERPSVRFQSSILVPAKPEWDPALYISQSHRISHTSTHDVNNPLSDVTPGGPTHTAPSTDPPAAADTTTPTDPTETTYPSDLHQLSPNLEHSLPWGDPGHTGRPHLQAVQVCRYAVLVTDVPVPPFVPQPAPAPPGPLTTRGGSAGLLAPRAMRLKSGARRQGAINAAFYEGSTLGDQNRRQSVEHEKHRRGFMWGLFRGIVNFVFPSYGLVAEMLDELQVSVEEQDERDQEQAAHQREEEAAAAAKAAAAGAQDVEMATGAQGGLAAHAAVAGGAAVRPVVWSDDVGTGMFGAPSAAAAQGAGGSDTTSTQSPGQLLQLGSLRANRKAPRSSSLRQRRTSGSPGAGGGGSPSYSSAFATSKAQRTPLDQEVTTTLDAAQETEEEEGEESKGLDGVSKVDKERVGRAVRALKARSHGWQLWAKARAAVRDGRVARLPASPAYDPVSAVFKALLPHDFDRAIPVLDYQRSHVLLRFWNWHMIGLDTALAVLEREHLRPRHVPCTGGLLQTHKVDTIDHLTKLVDKSQRDIVKERRAVLDGKGKNTGCYFVLFKTQAAAAMCATQNTALAENRGKFLIHAAPAPNDINWHSLPVPDARRRLMRWAMLLPKMIVILFPVAAFSSAFMQLDWVFCPSSVTYANTPAAPVGAPNAPPAPESDAWSWEWYCAQDNVISKLFKSLIVGWAPSWILSLYTAVILPNALHGLSQATYSFLSLSSLDMEICHLFWWFNVVNVFLCGMLGGTFMQQLNQALFTTGAAGFLRLLGTALPASSNFFINYLCFKALVGWANKMLIPNGGVFWYTFRRYLFRNYKTVSLREKAFALYTTRSPRYGPEIGNMFMVFVVGCAFTVVSPIVPGMAVIFFTFGYFVWKYLLMYNMVRKYETGGIYFHVVFERLLACLMIMVLFTAAAIGTKQGINQFLVIMLTLPWLIAFVGAHIRRRYGPMLNQRLPFEVAARAPHARINPEMYIHPALHPQALGWHPDLHMTWGGIGQWGTL